MIPGRRGLTLAVAAGLLTLGGCAQDDRARETETRVRALDGVAAADVTVVRPGTSNPGISVRPEPDLDGAALLALALEVRAVVDEEDYGTRSSLTFTRPDLTATARVSSLQTPPDETLVDLLDAWLLVADEIHRSGTPGAGVALGEELGPMPGPEIAIRDGVALTDLAAVIGLSDRLEPLLADDELSWRFGAATAGVVVSQLPDADDLALATSVAAGGVPEPGAAPAVGLISWHLDLAATLVSWETAIAVVAPVGEPTPGRDEVTVDAWGSALATWVDPRLEALDAAAADRPVAVRIDRGTDLADVLAQSTSATAPPETFSTTDRAPYQQEWDAWLAERARSAG